MSRKCLISLIVICLFIAIVPKESLAAHSQLHHYQNDDLHILFIYTNKQNKDSPNVKKIDLLLHHFTEHVKIVSEHEITLDHSEQVTHVVYYGEHKQQINDQVIQLINDFEGSVIFIGENVEQVQAYQHIERMEKVNIYEIGNQQDNDTTSLDYPIQINRILQTDEMDILLYGYKGSAAFPLLIQQGQLFYLATSQIDRTLKYYLADRLHDMLPNDHRSEHISYIRLEDIHPMSDAKKLREVGEYLNERNIPYILVVIPVYITPETGERVYYKDSPELVHVLQYLQANGGTVISHGYTHQYRDSETGEGFEFWDVENDQFIISMQPKESIDTIKSAQEFASRYAYESYIEPLKEKERQYIHKRMKNSIHELTYYNLYPLAFEAPHYTMSQQGYSIASTYFTTIFGQIQYSDEKWELMGAPPYMTTASYLGGMTVLPETIGYVDLSLEQPFKETSNQLDRALIVRDSMIGGFYHPYLGVEYLPEFLEQYNKVPNMTWLDLKQTTQQAKTSKVTIASDGTGEIHVTNHVKWWESMFRHQQLSLFERILWGVTIVVFAFIVLFFLLTIYLRTQLRKRLFRERKTIG